MPKSTVKKFAKMSEYKGPAVSDLKNLPKGEIVPALWISKFDFLKADGKPDPAPLVLVGDVDTKVLNALKATTGSDGKPYKDKIKTDGNVLLTEPGKWATDKDALKQALVHYLGPANVKKADPLTTLQAEAAKPPLPAWQAQWDKDLKEFLGRVTKLPDTYADLKKQAALDLAEAKKSVTDGGKAGGIYRNAVSTWTEALRKKLDGRAIAIAKAAPYPTLTATARQAVLGRAVAQIKAAVDAAALAGIAADLEAGILAELDKELADQRRPDRATWMTHLGVTDGKLKVVECDPTYKLHPEVCHTHYTIAYNSANNKRVSIHDKTSAEVLKAVFMDGVASMEQAHATLERVADDSKCPHLYLDKTWDPKQLKNTVDDAAVKKVLEPVHAALTTWLVGRIKELQKQVG